MSNWAPIVFGRTHEVDFRFIATPVDFTAKEQTWAEQYIRVTTRSPEKLREEPLRWSAFKNESICVIGVTCMASTLSENMTQDSKLRQLYIFVGYVSRTPLAEFPPMDIELFKPNYEYVRQKWNEEPYNKSRHEPIRTQYNEHLPKIVKVANIDDEYFCLNQTDSEILRVWPDNESDRQHLWQVASQAQSVSLCLGLASKKDALLNASPFLNITASDVLQKDDLSRKSSIEKEEELGDEPIPKEPKEDEQMTKKSIFFPILMATILGGLIGAIALSWVLKASGGCNKNPQTQESQSNPNSGSNSPPTHNNSQTPGAESDTNNPTTPSPTRPEKSIFDQIRINTTRLRKFGKPKNL
jgi:hypothetical protein